MNPLVGKAPVIIEEKHRRALQECRDLCLVYFTAQLSDLYDNVHDIMWDFADRAETNDLQRRFIDAATVVTNGRSDLEFAFRELISKGFSDFSAGRHLSNMFDNVPQEYLDHEAELELLSKEETEESVAIKNIVDKTKSSCYQYLYALGQRLSLVRGGVKVNDFDIPAGPLHTIYAFRKAAEALPLSMDIRLVLFFLFEKYVMKEIASIYERYNECLINVGIFPNLKYTAPKNSSPKPEKPRGSDGRADDFIPNGVDEITHSVSGVGGTATGKGQVQGSPVSEEIFNAICGLLTMRRKSDPLFQQHPELNPNAPPVAMTTKPDLVAVIGDIQQAVSKSYVPIKLPDLNENDDALINTTILEQIQNRPANEQNQIFDGVERRRIPFADLDTIEFVGMLFEYVLNDKDLPNVAKALISHLHTPYLKVAVLDKDFLTNDQHVSRKLLNLMLEAGRNWVDETQLIHGAYYSMERQVERILHEFHEDIGLFDELLADFTNDINALEQKARSNEERALEAERGRDRLEGARRRAAEVLEKHIGSRELPEVMRTFMFHVWMDRMTLLLLRNPKAEETASWKRTLIIVDALLWAIDAPNDKAKQQKLGEIYPVLKRRIEKYLSAVGGYYEPESQALFDLLVEYQTGKKTISEDVRPEPVAQDELMLEHASNEKEFLHEDSEEIEFAGLVPDAVATTELPDTPDTSETEEEDGEFTIEEELIAKRLRISEFGTWFEIIDDATGMPKRVKLSWYSPMTKKYMFVDRNGIQAAVRPLKRLVKELSSGKAHILEPPEQSFLDQAINAIKHMLERAADVVKSAS